MISVESLLGPSPYAGYAYSYPHKTAYGPLDPPVPLSEAWAMEPRDALFLYLHVPFCEMRCGFCNLFTTVNPQDDLVSCYLAALRRQAARVRSALGPVSIGQMAIGGGTPTYLDPDDLHTLLAVARDLFGADPKRIPVSVETSPLTASEERLAVLREAGVTRISIGVQSFVERETAAAGRAQRRGDVEQALSRIREAGFPILNLDLIYGLPGQSVTSWLESLRAALQYDPEELYLYPLYIRPLTGLDRRLPPEEDQRLACYRAGRALLLDAGYLQVSMRMFRKARIRGEEPCDTAYCCQEDGMIGLGCGARSYTRRLHYATEYAVGRRGVREILADYVARPDAAFDVADYGCRLNSEEKRRRFVIKSLLRCEGLSTEAYRQRFGSEPREDLPELADLERLDLASASEDRLRLTESGLERSDAIGPWLYSGTAKRRMEAFVLR